MNLFDQFFLQISKEKGTLLSFLVHGVFLNEKEREAHLVDPQDNPTLDQFREFLYFFLDKGYEFIDVKNIRSLNPGKKYALLTFDDGYYNNLHVLPVLNELNIPAVFYVTTHNVCNNVNYWWDVIYRERYKRGISVDNIHLEQKSLKDFKYYQIEDYIYKNFGTSGFHPVNEIDRPLTPAEFIDFASKKHVTIGNHCEHHALLTSYNKDEIKEEIKKSQEKLNELLGYYPDSIAYPNGNFNSEVLEVVKEFGFSTAFTTIQEKTLLPLPENEKHVIHRFIMKFGKLKNNGLAYRCDNRIFLKVNDLLNRKLG